MTDIELARFVVLEHLRSFGDDLAVGGALEHSYSSGGMDGGDFVRIALRAVQTARGVEIEFFSEPDEPAVTLGRIRPLSDDEKDRAICEPCGGEGMRPGGMPCFWCEGRGYRL